MYKINKRVQCVIRYTSTWSMCVCPIRLLAFIRLGIDIDDVWLCTVRVFPICTVCINIVHVNKTGTNKLLKY